MLKQHGNQRGESLKSDPSSFSGKWDLKKIDISTLYKYTDKAGFQDKEVECSDGFATQVKFLPVPIIYSAVGFLSG